jgi:hypothetical protein
MKNKEMTKKEMNFFISFFLVFKKTIFVSNTLSRSDLEKGPYYLGH